MTIDSLSTNYLQSIFNAGLQGAGSPPDKTGNTPTGIDSSPVAVRLDNSQLSPFAQLMSTLQQLQQSDPTRYQQVTQQIATNLQTAAQNAQAEGKTTTASQLNQLANDFADAAKSGQLPNIQDLAQAIGGHHHRHHHHSHAAGADSDGAASTTGTSSSASSSSASQTRSQLLSAFQSNEANGTQSGALNPMAIIRKTLSNAGITSSNG